MPYNADPELKKNWQDALTRVFPNGVPDHASWAEKAQIIQILKAIGAKNTGHMFYPGGGGDDLTGASSIKDLVDLHSGDPSHGVTRVSVASLEFTCPEGQTEMAYFQLNLAPISGKPEFKESDEFREEFGEGKQRTYTVGECDAGVDRAGNDLPNGVRRVVRYWAGGKFVVFSKASPYNDHGVTRKLGFDAYDAYHMDDAAFQETVTGLASALSAPR